MPAAKSTARWLNRNILSLGLVSLGTDLSTEMSYAVLPIFLKDVLKASPLFIGLVEAVAESTASILKTFSGYLSDRLKKRKFFILAGYGLSAVVKPLLALVQQSWHVLVVRFADRFGKGIRTAPRDALIADSTPRRFFGRVYGFHRMLDTAGAMLGPALAFAILALSHQNYRLLFALAFIPGLAAIAVILFGVRDSAPVSPAPLRFSLRDVGYRTRMLFLIVGIFTLGNSSDAFLILRAKDVGISVTLIPLVWLVFNLSYFLWSYPAGIISDRIGRRLTIVFGFLIFSLCYGSLALNRSPLAVWIIFAIYGLYYGFTEGNLRAYVADLTPGAIRGTVFGIYNTVVGFLLLPANLIMGILWQRFGFSRALLLGSTLSLVAAGLLLLLMADDRARPAVVPEHEIH